MTEHLWSPGQCGDDCGIQSHAVIASSRAGYLEALQAVIEQNKAIERAKANLAKALDHEHLMFERYNELTELNRQENARLDN